MKEIMNEWRRFFKKDLLDMNVLYEAYSSGLVSSLKKKWKTEVPTLTDQQIEAYIDTFDKHKNSEPIKKAKGPDITKYSWQELEELLDANFSIRSANEIKIEGDLEPVYKSPDGTLQIFLGDRREKCIKIRQDFETRSGQQYDWCISRSDASNMFSSYRFRLNEPVFYYIFDAERDTSDPLHTCVIYVNSSGKYFLASARNSGDKEHSWEELVQMMPKLSQIKSVFKHIPLSPREREIYEKVGNELSDKDFFNLSRDLKEEYIGFGHVLTEKQLRNVFSLPDGKDLINKYCNMHQNVILPLDIYNKLPSATKKVIEKNFESHKKEIYELLYLGKKDISGYLDFRDMPIYSLPEGLRVEGSLDLAYTNITSLPKGLKVGGSLVLAHAKITSLPEGLEVGGNLYLAYSNITSLPEGLRVGGDLDLAYTNITSLPEGLEVGGKLDLYNSNITSLPEGLRVGGDLDLSYTKITSLPKGLEVVRNLNLSYSNIISLPKGLEVGRTLNLFVTEIASLPAGLRVGGNLYLDETKITSLPPDLYVRGQVTPDKFQDMYDKMKTKITESKLKKTIRIRINKEKR